MLLPKKVKVSCKDGKVYYGYFHSFEDYWKLKEGGKFRFIPDSKVSLLKNNTTSEKLNNMFSVIITVENVVGIDFINDEYILGFNF